MNPLDEFRERHAVAIAREMNDFPKTQGEFVPFYYGGEPVELDPLTAHSEALSDFYRAHVPGDRDPSGRDFNREAVSELPDPVQSMELDAEGRVKAIRLRPPA